jgi:U3 small nucleolar RNA-associated protein 21
MPDSLDTALLKVMGIAPPGARLNATAAAAAAAAAGGDAAAAGRDGTAAAGAEAPVRHGASVYGVAVDVLNATLVSADAAGQVIFWDFTTHTAQHSLRMPAGVSALVLHRDAGLAALACDDAVVRVLDVAARRQVRTFNGHTNRITDMAFSPDARWLATSSLDRTIRVWDLPSGRCVDWLAFGAAPLSLAFAPTSEYLVTSHVDSPGVFLWANRAHFSTVFADAIPAAPTHMDLPQSASAAALGDAESATVAAYGADEGAGGTDAASAASTAVTSNAGAAGGAGAGDADEAGRAAKRARLDGATGAATTAVGSAAPKPGCRVTLAGAPLSAWQHLSKLDQILARNKPREPPKKADAAPFFLPTTAGLKPSFAPPTESATDGAPASRIGRQEGSLHGAGSGLGALLARAAATVGSARSDAFAAIATHLSALTPSAVDAEVRSVCLGVAEDVQGVAALATLLEYFAWQLAAGAHFELAQAHLQLVLQVHQEVVAQVPALRKAVRRVAKLQQQATARLSGMLDSGLCLTSAFLGQ